jgi:Peptidase family C25
MMRLTILLLLLWSSILNVSAQMPVGSDTLYGNEWITYGQPYYKIQLAHNGIYRIPSTMLPINSVPANRYQIYHNGKRIPVYTTTQGIPTANDYIEFYGQKNTNEIDSFMYKYGSISQLNPDYSVISDTSAYFLTWSNAVNPEVYTPTPNPLTNLPPKETYFMYDWRNEYHNSYSKAAAGDVYVPEYGKGEGYSSGWAVNRTLNLTPPALYAGQSGTLTFRMLKDDGTHYTKIDINGSNVHRDTTYGYIYKGFDFPMNVVGNSVQLDIQGQFTASGDLYDWHSIGHLQLRYARKFDFENKKFFEFTLPAVAYVKYLEIENFNHEGVAPILYDVANKVRIETTLLNGKVAVALPPMSGATARQLVLVNASTGRNNVTELSRTEFEDLRFSNSDYIIISHPKLYDDGQGNNYVQQYADYRGTQEGGAYRPKMVNIQQLYEQFGYGINRHPIAIRNFTNFIQKNWRNPEPPKYLFIIGKGRESNTIRPHESLNVPVRRPFLIPTWGYPGSDNLLAGSHQMHGATIPVGRLAAITGNEVRIYLDKVRAQETNQRTLPQTIEARAWMKNGIHLTGGASQFQEIKGYMDGMRNKLQSSAAAMNLTTFEISTTNPVQTSQTEQIFEKINQGVSLITFFGHSATATLEFDINYPSRFNNVGKYPFFIALGCGAGNLNLDIKSVSEDFVLYENKGSVAFGASSGLGYSYALHNFINTFYQELGLSQNLGLGDYIQRAARQLPNSMDNGTLSAMQEFTLHGDPAVRLRQLSTPDYLPDASTVRFFPEALTTRLDSFDLTFNLANLGAYQRDEVGILIEQLLPTGVVKLLLKTKVATPKYSETYTLRLPMYKEAFGKNQIYVKVDPDNLIAETAAGAEANNDLVTNGARGITVYISDNSAQMVAPQPFAIVNELPIVLKASTSNAITKERRYFMELDTNAFFNSGFKKRTTLNSIGGVLKWQLDTMNWQPNTVYYWRVSPDSVDAYGYTWQEASFIYLPQSSPGWNQSHYFQFLKNRFENMRVSPYDRTFQYVNDIRVFVVKNKVSVWPFASDYSINNAFAGRSCVASEFLSNTQPTVNVWVFDSVTMKPWRRDDYNYGMRHRAYSLSFFMFNTLLEDTVTGRAALLNFLESVPNNNYVVVNTVQPTPQHTYKWDEPLLQHLEAQGAQAIRRTIIDTFPYIFAYKKGGRRPLVEQLGRSLNDTLEASITITGHWFEGKMFSERIGPSLQWDSLALNMIHTQLKDTNRYSIYGILPDGVTRHRLDTNLIAGKSLTHINATTYPYLQLGWYARDSTTRTCSQLDYWRVFYKGLPEVALNASRRYKISADSVERGENVNIEMAVENVGLYHITDSLTFKYSYTDNQNRSTTRNKRLKPLAKGESVVTNFTIDSHLLSDKIKVDMEVNPERSLRELIYTNNIGQTQFYVAVDRRNPLLEVTFDGQRILNNDIVSPQPAIRIALKDENRFLALSDTSLFRLYLKKPGLAEPEKQLFFNLNPELRWIPAGSDLTKNNRAMVEYRPQFVKDGLYTLRIEATDASNNIAGTSDYQVGFKVITKSSLSNVLNYPNPFSTSTQFIYTLTGLDIPTAFKIQIMTMSGKIVREITQKELGDLKIGTHRTDFKWDGTDEFGDKLANGVYLYRIVAKKQNGSNYETFDTGTDDLFKGGFGKLVIVR